MILELRKREKFQLEGNSSEKQGKHRQVLLRFALGWVCVRACVCVCLCCLIHSRGSLCLLFLFREPLS